MPAGLHHDPRQQNSRGVIERSLRSFVDALEYAFYSEALARKNGLLQKLDPRIKILALLPLIMIAALSRRLWSLQPFSYRGGGRDVSNVPLRTLVTRVWLGVLTFTGHFASSLVPHSRPAAVRSAAAGWIVTAQGLRAVLYLIMRAQTAATFSVLLVLCTPWSSLLKALRVLRLPIVLVVVLA